MNTTKKIAIALAVMVMAAMVAPAVMAQNNIGYTATIGAGQNTVLHVLEGNFGTLTSPSLNNTINDTFELKNTGNKNATVKANFTTKVGSPAIYGLTKGLDVIGGSNFSLQADAGGNKDALYNNGSLRTLSYQVPADGAWHTYDAWLNVPPMMPDGSYAGNVRLTFADA